MFSHNVYYKTIMAMIRVLCYHHPVNSHSLDPTGIHFHSLKWQAKIKMVLQKKKKRIQKAEISSQPKFPSALVLLAFIIICQCSK